MGHSMNDAYSFLSGAAAMGAWIGGLYFLKFWSRTKERLFLLFAVAFWIMSMERIILLFMKDSSREDYSNVYLIRLAAFVVILYAIVIKNKRSKGKPH